MLVVKNHYRDRGYYENGLSPDKSGNYEKVFQSGGIYIENLYKFVIY
jgi:hypothetical protein